MTDVHEFLSICKSDYRDSDADYFYDAYEYNCADLSPVYQRDGADFCQILASHFGREGPALAEYSDYLSWEWYKSLNYGEYSPIVQVSSFLEDTVFERDSGDFDWELFAISVGLTISEAIATVWCFPEAWPAVVLYSLAEIAGHWVLESIPSACWSNWDEDWATWCPFDDMDAYNPAIRQTYAGWISQVGYGLYANGGGGEELSGILSGLSSRYQTIYSYVTGGWFHPAIRAISEAYSLFGTVYDAADPYAPLYGRYSIAGNVVVDKDDPNFRYYSHAEYLMWRFSYNVGSWLGTNTELLSIHNDPITTGEVANDLTLLAYDTFIWLKCERLLLATLLQPDPLGL